MTNNCDVPYHMKEQLAATSLFRVFDPSFAAASLDEAFVHRLQSIDPLKEHIDFDVLMQELPAYLSACKGFTVNHGCIKDFTAKVLKWWANNHQLFSEWAKAARIRVLLHPKLSRCRACFLFLEGHVRG